MGSWVKRHIPEQPQEVAVYRRVDEQQEDPPRESPPGVIPIESVYQMTQVPETMTLAVGTAARVLQTPAGELITLDPQQYGLLAGCGHYVYHIDPVITEHGYYRGIGGRCSYCAGEAALLLKQNVISLREAEAMSIYCSSCASCCDGCRRTSLCVRHARPSQEPDGTVLMLCPECFEKAKRDRRRSFMVALALRPFARFLR